MNDEIQLISDGAGLAVIGEPAAVEAFLVSENLPSKDLGLPRLTTMLGTGGAVAQTGSEIAANSGRWVKLTKESAKLVEKHGLRESKRGFSTGVLKGKNGQIKGFVEFARSPGTLLTNPAVLAGAAGIMAQLAMQQTMDEITDYLEKIDRKVDDVLRAQKDAVLADMIGVDLVIEEALTIRKETGRVSEVTWSKVQATAMTIARTQAYALRQIEALAEKLENSTRVGDLADATEAADADVRQWLAVLARCFQLQEGLAILELDRVLDSSPDELDQHRLALRTAREHRLERISQTTKRLMARMDAATGEANAKVLLHPASSRDVFRASDQVAASITDFHGRLGIEGGRDSIEALRWLDAAAQVRDRAIESGAEGVDAARQFGNVTLGRAKMARTRLSSGLPKPSLRRRRPDHER